MVVDLVNKLIILPSQQTSDHGYAGMVEQDELYVLRTNTPWAPIVDPGPYRTMDPCTTDNTNLQSGIIYTMSKKVFDFEAKIKQVVI